MSARRTSIKAAAVAFGVDHRTLKTAADAAGVKADRAGAFNLDELRDALAQHSDSHMRLGHSLANRGGDVGGSNLSTLAEAKARSEAQRARKLQLQTDTLEGKLIRRDDARAAVVSAVGRARVALLSLGPRLAPRLLGETNERVFVATVEAEVRLILDGLAAVADELDV